jgi:cystathionine beta-lyase/cystathionine gamma-synthase
VFSALEGAESTLIMASGMCASTVLLMALVPAGGHLVTTTDCYRKTRIFIETILPRMGIKVYLFCWLLICNLLYIYIKAFLLLLV